MILNITSYPRSGNSFVATTLLRFGSRWGYTPRGTRGILPVDFCPVGSLYSPPMAAKYGIKLFPWCRDAFDTHPSKYETDPHGVYVYKRHDTPDDYAGPRIYLVRDGRDVLYSFAHHNLVHRMICADPQHQEAIATTELPIGLINGEANRLLNDPNSQWGPIVSRGISHPNVVAVIRYEAMKKAPLLEVMAALARAGYSVKSVVDGPTWDDLHNIAPHFFWQGKTGGYRALHPDIIRTFERQNEHTLKELHYL